MLNLVIYLLESIDFIMSLTIIQLQKGNTTSGG